MTKKKDQSKRWRRVFTLRRAFLQQIVYASGGFTPKVCMTDRLDDVIYAALAREAALERRRRG
jgi:hypothetical protein